MQIVHFHRTPPQGNPLLLSNTNIAFTAQQYLNITPLRCGSLGGLYALLATRLVLSFSPLPSPNYLVWGVKSTRRISLI